MLLDAADYHLADAAAREPRLDFVCRACDYFEVSADYLLGRTDEEGNTASGALAKARLREIAEKLRELAGQAEV